VYSKQRPGTYLFITPGKIDRLTGGSIYNRKLRDSLVERGARVRTLSVPDLPYFPSLFLSILIAPWIALRFIDRGYDAIILDSWAHPALALFSLALRPASRIRVVAIVHQLRGPERRAGAARFIAESIERASLARSDLIVTVSDFMRRNIEELLGAGRPVLVARPGCDLRRQRVDIAGKGVKAGPVRLLFVGNCVRRKGLDLLVSALSRVEGAPVRLDLVGSLDFDPQFAAELRRTVEHLGLTDVVRFHGRVTDDALERIYGESDIFVMPSYYEGYGIVYGEAMQAGLPIIAVDSGAVREIVREGENALLVPPGDPRALAEAITRLAADVDLRNQFARRSLELARELPAWSDTCEQIIRALRSQDFDG
jgi:glycosyltransferase involved in cell wall biosynthesis